MRFAECRGCIPSTRRPATAWRTCCMGDRSSARVTRRSSTTRRPSRCPRSGRATTSRACSCADTRSRALRRSRFRSRRRCRAWTRIAAGPSTGRASSCATTAAIGRCATTFGRRMAYTTPDSQSGYQALRALVASERRPFSEMIGPLVTPRGVVEAVLAGRADAGPVDSYALDLMRLHEPALVAPLRVVATTPPTPIPPLVASPDCPRARPVGCATRCCRWSTRPHSRPRGRRFFCSGSPPSTSAARMR